jgi:hypothetical protein
MTKDAVTTDDVAAFITSCTFVHRVYMHYHELFEPNNPHEAIFSKLSPLFFHDINRVLIMSLILEACKLAVDPAEDPRGYENLSVQFFVNHADFSTDSAASDEFNNRAKAIREFGKKLKSARDKMISHLDRATNTNLSGTNLGGVSLAEWDNFWLDLEAFAQLLCLKCFGTTKHNLILDVSDAAQLVETLGDGLHENDNSSVLSAFARRR